MRGDARRRLEEAAGAADALEANVSRLLGLRFALAVASGTAALETALRACGVEFGDEVVLSPYDWGAAAGACLRLGAIPVFADIDPEHLTLDAASVKRVVGPRCRAVVVTHIYGYPADVPAIVAVARCHGIRVIEDAAQAFGASRDGDLAGSRGDVGCLSFGRGKPVTGGEGGMVVTNDPEIYEAAVHWSQHPARQMALLGDTGGLADMAPNWRLNPLAAAMVLEEIGTWRERRARRAANCRALAHALAGLDLLRPPLEEEGVESAWHRVVLSYRPPACEVAAREEILDALATRGVPACRGFIARPLHLDPVFARRSYGATGWPWRQAGSTRRYRQGMCPVAEARIVHTDVGIDADWEAPESGTVMGMAETIRSACAAHSGRRGAHPGEALRAGGR